MLDADRIIQFICGGFLIFQAVYLVWIKAVLFNINVEEQILYQNQSNYVIITIIAAILFAFTGFLILTQLLRVKYFIIATIATHFMLISFIPLFLNYENDPHELQIIPIPHPYFIIQDIIKIVKNYQSTTISELIFGFANMIIWRMVHVLEN